MAKKEETDGFDLRTITSNIIERQGKRRIINNDELGYKVYYKTRICPMLDYALGYKYDIVDDDYNKIGTETAMGILEGSSNLIYGPPSSSKSTLMMQICGNIIRPFPLSQLYVFDVERSWTMPRIMQLTRYTPADIENKKVIQVDDHTTLDDFRSLMAMIYEEKRNNKSKFMYTSDIRDMKGNYIKTLQPTVVLLDSIAALVPKYDYDTKDGKDRLEKGGSDMDKTRFAKNIAAVWNEIKDWQSEVNIILMEINQARDKIQTGIIPEAATIHGMKQKDALPGGSTPRFLASGLLETTATGHKTIKTDGYSGFTVNLKVIKNRNNAGGGIIIPLINEPTKGGISYVRSTLEYAKSCGLLIGNKNKMRFVNDPDNNYFTMTDAPDDFKENRILYKIMHQEVLPLLDEAFLQNTYPEAVDEEGDY